MADDQYSQAKVGPTKPQGTQVPDSRSQVSEEPPQTQTPVPTSPATAPPPALSQVEGPVQAAPTSELGAPSKALSGSGKFSGTKTLSSSTLESPRTPESPAPAVPPPAEELPSPVEEIIPGAPASKPPAVSNKQQATSGMQEKGKQAMPSTPSPTATPPVAPAISQAPSASPMPAPSTPPPAMPAKPPVPSAAFGASAMIKKSSPKIFKILLVLLVLIVIGIAVYFFFFYRITLKIAPATTGTKMTLDGKEIKSGVYRVMPGIHSISIEKDGYISYEVKQNFSASQKLSFTASLKEALPPELVASGAKLASLASSAQALNFVSSDGHLAFALADPQNQGKFASENLSNGSYEGIRKLLFSDDDKFVLILDTKALRVLDFAKTDLINQVEADLPPSANLISSVSWNSGKSTYFPEPNSRIIYDLKTSEGWNLVSATRSHDKSDLVMQIDPKKFKNLVLDWRESPKDILIVGGPVCTFDIVNRTDCKIVSAEGKSDYVWGEWGKKAKYAVAVDASGELWVLKNEKLEDMKIKTVQGLVSWIDENNAYMVTSSRPIRVNFDTGEIINYADIKGLRDATSFGVLGTNVFFTDAEGLQKASLASEPYNK